MSSTADGLCPRMGGVATMASWRLSKWATQSAFASGNPTRRSLASRTSPRVPSDPTMSRERSKGGAFPVGVLPEGPDAEAGDVPEAGGGEKRWEDLAEIINDCGNLLVSGAGNAPRKVLEKKGIRVHEVEGVIEDIVNKVFEGKDLGHLIKRAPRACGSECEGTGMGCL